MFFAPKVLSSVTFLYIANLFLGMILMVVLNSLLTGIRSRDKNYLFLALFFTGTLINAISNLYTDFFVPTIEPYIGSWLSLFAFNMFSCSYLGINKVGYLRIGRNILAVLCSVFLLLSIIHHVLNPGVSNLLIQMMDISAAIIILILFITLIVLKARGYKRAGSLIVFEILMIIGAVSAMGIIKEAVSGAGIIPQPLLDGNFLFLIGMTFNGLLFSFVLGSEMTELKVRSVFAEREKTELQQIDRAKNDFMMNISHELRTPVTIIGGIIGQLRKGRWGDSISGAEPQFEAMERNNLRLMKQITNLLELSQLEQHKLKPNFVEFNLNNRINLFVAEFQSLAEEKQLEISFVPDEIITLTADLHLFDTAVLNLLGNAVKFTPCGGSISLRAWTKMDSVLVDVRDTGSGIPLQQQKNIFKRFWQAELPEHSSWHGAGIGLALVKEIMELHKGQVYLESGRSGGAVFCLSFPVQVAVKTGQAEPTGSDSVIAAYRAELESGSYDDENENQTDPTAGKGIAALLIVEDNVDLLNYLRTELSADFNVVTAENGIIALECLKLFKPELIISDVMMPEMDGRQLYLELQKNSETAKIPFLFLTARDSSEERLLALKEGAVDYISKPFLVGELKAKTAAIVDSIAQNRESYKTKLKESILDLVENFDEGSSTGLSDGFDKLCAENDLTKREKDIAVLIRKGLSDKEIASSLNISAKTVSNYNTSLFRKFKVSGRLELMALAR